MHTTMGQKPNTKLSFLIFTKAILQRIMYFGQLQVIMITQAVLHDRRIISYLITTSFLCQKRLKQAVLCQIVRRSILIIMAIFILFLWILMAGRPETHVYMIPPAHR